MGAVYHNFVAELLLSQAEKFSELGLKNSVFVRRKIGRWVLLAITGGLTGNRLA